jgi:hypothetical protein
MVRCAVRCELVSAKLFPACWEFSGNMPFKVGKIALGHCDEGPNPVLPGSKFPEKINRELIVD